MRILVVDDNEINRKVLRVNITAEGHTVLEAADGVEALSVLDREPVDAVISDILMPNMDGYRLCLEVHKSERFKDMPFIMYTSTYTSPADEKLSLQAGANKFLTKPVPTETILQTLEELIAGAPRQVTKPPDGPQELDIMKEYSEVLVRKLEEKNAELERAREDLQRANRALETRVRERTVELEAANKELEAFSYSISHDLRAPLRAIDGFSRIVLEEHAAQLPQEAQRYLGLVRDNTQQMGCLIDDLLAFSRLSYQKLRKRNAMPAELVRDVVESLRQEQQGRKVEISIGELPICQGDPGLLKQVFANLIANALKFTRPREVAEIEIGSDLRNGEAVYYVRDNGVGFDMQYADKLFGVFQRLHRAEEFEGTGVGLAIVHRIIHRHGGRIWAESKKDHGATFYFTLGER